MTTIIFNFSIICLEFVFTLRKLLMFYKFYSLFFKHQHIYNLLILNASD